MTKQTKRYLLIISLILFLTAVTAVFFAGKNISAKAQNTPTLTLYSPSEYYEYYLIGEPKSVYEDDNYYAFTHTYGASNENKSLVIFYKQTSEYKIIESLTNPGQITIVYGVDTAVMLYQENHQLLGYDLTNKAVIEVLCENPSDSTPAVNLSNFSHCGDYFAISGENSITLCTYSFDNGKVIFTETEYKLSTTNSSIVAINSTDLYYAVGGDLYYGKISSLLNNSFENEKLTANTYTPTYITASENKLYAVHSNGIVVFDKSNGFNKSAYQLTFDTSLGLGKIQKAVSLSLYGNTLLIANETRTIQKFDATTLTFLGKATATTEDSFNRIPSTAKAMDIYDKTLSVLSPTKIIVTNTNTKEFKSISIDVGSSSYTPNMIASGKNTVAIANSGEIRIYSYQSNGNYQKAETSNLVSCDYQNGLYYFLSMNNGGEIYVYNEDGILQKTITDFSNIITGGSLLAIDVDGNINVYVSNNNGVYRFTTNENNKAVKISDTPYILSKSSIKIATDLDGNVYSLCDQNIIEKVDIATGTVSETSLLLNTNLDKKHTGITDTDAISFALNYDSKEVYFILSGQSLILKTADLDNRSITYITGANQMVLNGENATNELKKVTLTGKNLYKVTVGESATFNYIEKTVASGKEYLILGETDGYTLLLSEELYLIKSEQLPTPVNPIKSSNKTTLFVAGGVNLYYYPVLSVDNLYTLKTLGETVRIENGASLSVLGEVTINSNKFYLVTVNVGGQTYKGYAPAEFLRDTLIENDVYSNLTHVTVKANAVLYAEDKTTILYTFTTDTLVRSYGEKDNYHFVELVTTDGAIKGYILSTDIKVVKDNTIRNAVIIITITVAITATALFLIHKKKTFVTVD